jgi:hypothetical protein
MANIKVKVYEMGGWHLEDNYAIIVYAEHDTGRGTNHCRNTGPVWAISLTTTTSCGKMDVCGKKANQPVYLMKTATG